MEMCYQTEITVFFTTLADLWFEMSFHSSLISPLLVNRPCPPQKLSQCFPAFMLSQYFLFVSTHNDFTFLKSYKVRLSALAKHHLCSDDMWSTRPFLSSPNIDSLTIDCKYLIQCTCLVISCDPLTRADWIPKQVRFPGKRFNSCFKFRLAAEHSESATSKFWYYNSSKVSIALHFQEPIETVRKKREHNTTGNKTFRFLSCDIYTFLILQFTAWIICDTFRIRILLYSLEKW